MPFRRVIQLATIVAFVLAVPLAALADVGVTINGNSVSIAPQPIIQAGRVFVPLRGVFEQLGASVVYDAGAINATGNGRLIALRIGSTNATVDGQPQTLDVAPFIIGASTYVPLRFVSEALGASVTWDDGTSTVEITMAGVGNAPPDNGAQGSDMSPPDDVFADDAPPPIPDYQAPPVPAPDEIWQPGYWQYGPNGYYWVPGTWVEPPQPGYLWTPGYWQARQNRFVFTAGYWAPSVGFYGGVNYGGGYFGHGYSGARWSNGSVQYNTYVTRVNTTVVHNVYVDRNVTIVNSSHTSYNGGPHGVQARPTSDDTRVAEQHHVAMTPVQQQHVQAAAADRRNLATVNHDQPPVPAVARPLAVSAPARAPAPPAERPAPPAERPAPPAERPAAPPAERPAPAVEHPAPPVEHPAAPVEHPAPVEHAAPVAPVPPPFERPAPVTRTALPVRQALPVQPAPVQRTAPPVREAPAVRPAPPVQRPAPPVQRPAAPPVQRPAAPPVQHHPAPEPHETRSPDDHR